jgi:hypothetical protein
VLTATHDIAGACAAALTAIKLAPGGHLGVLPSEVKRGIATVPTGIYPQLGLRAAVTAFDLLIRPACDDIPRPAWWNDEALLLMSQRAVTDTPQSLYALNTRCYALMGIGGTGEAGALSRGWKVGNRSAAQLREAADLLKQQARLEPPGSGKGVQALTNSAAILEKAMRMERDERSAKKGGADPPADGVASPPPAAPKSPARSAAVKSPTRGAAALKERARLLDEQIAALEKDLARRGIEIS